MAGTSTIWGFCSVVEFTKENSFNQATGMLSCTGCPWDPLRRAWPCLRGGLGPLPRAGLRGQGGRRGHHPVMPLQQARHLGCARASCGKRTCMGSPTCARTGPPAGKGASPLHVGFQVALQHPRPRCRDARGGLPRASTVWGSSPNPPGCPARADPRPQEQRSLSGVPRELYQVAGASFKHAPVEEDSPGIWALTLRFIGISTGRL